MENGFFDQMCREAGEELASGKKGTWREIDTNTLLLACFGRLTNHLTHKLTRPLWWFAGSVSAGVVAFIVKSFIEAV